MTSLPQDLTADALLKWQADTEAELERVLTANTVRALSVIVDQAMSFSLTAASARHLWEEAVDQTVESLGMGVDGLLREDLLAAAVGDEAFETVNKVMALTNGAFQDITKEELRAVLTEALDLNVSLTASGASDEYVLDDEEIAELAAIDTFWGHENWIEQTGTGHLPKYIRAIADALMRKGMTESHAIAVAVNTVKRWARKGTASKHGGGKRGKAHVSAKTQAKAIAALVEWEAKRAEARATAVQKPVSLVAAGGLMERLLKPIAKWRHRIKRQVRTGFTGVVGRLTLAEMRRRGHETKTWVTKRDDRVRETHHLADGQTVPIDQAFRVGLADLQYPGERGKPLEETANCRCVLVPGVK